MMAMEQGASELYAETVSAWLATHLLVQSKSYVPYEDDRSAGDISDARLRRVIEFISVRFGEQLTLERLAAEAGISKFHFTRLFREKVGQTPYRYLSEIRLAAAAKMLVTTDLRIGEIALLCGYPIASHFTTAFSARYGAPPLEFRTSRATTHQH
jgi:AraC family transcriptional regulator